MNAPTPTGELVPAIDGHDLVLTRMLPCSGTEAWASITDPELTARWFGRWEGKGAVGETIRIQLGFEGDSPWAEAKIVECEAPTYLRVVTEVGDDQWDLSIELSDAEVHTDLRFVMHGINTAGIGSIGPGWEYYLDQLVASITGGPMPDFNDYHPAQQDYFEALPIQ